MKAPLNRWGWAVLAAVTVLCLMPTVALAAGPTVLTVPVDPTNPTSPHTTYAITSSTESMIVLGATVPSAWGTGHMFNVDWNFADGSPDTKFSFTDTGSVPSPYGPYAYDISTTHNYPASSSTGTTWTATVTVKDTNTGLSTTTNFFVIQEDNNLASRVNVAIDLGLWYMHQTMWRANAPANGQTVNWGGWDEFLGGSGTCPNLEGSGGVNNNGYHSWDCGNYGSIDASNVQAFEVNGHLQNGPASDPYTDDVYRGLNRMESFIAQTHAPSSASDTADAFGQGAVVYSYNPATMSYICNDGSIPSTGDPTCSAHGGEHQYNGGATSCTAPPCAIAYDVNSNTFMAYSADGSNEYIYTTSPFLETLVASGTPNATATVGPYAGQTFKTIVGDIMDFYGFSQYGSDCDVSNGNARGNGGSCAGGGWLYSPKQGDDNSTSQWAAIAFISGSRGFGISIPKAITDFNNVWATNGEDADPTLTPAPTGTDPFAASDNLGAYGYRGNFYYSNVGWGPFAETPSGMVQLALDGVGRTKNTKLGDASSDFDQRWNNVETYYADNFCNSVTPYNQATNAPRAYMYGMYSFTKSMLEHNEGGTLAPIQFLRTQTPNVFAPADPSNTLDWYGAVSPANGGTDACDGVAQTLVSYQQTPVNGVYDGHWYGNTTPNAQGGASQTAYETSWALIMLRKTVFVSCIKNLYARGTPGNVLAPPRVDLTWSVQTNATSYAILRGTTSGGPYTQVGTSTGTAFSDRTKGLVNTDTYYYVVQPIINAVEICQSNEAKVTIP